MNLVKNSIKFTEEGYIVIEVDYEQSQSLLSVKIRDTGVGLSENEIPKLFKKFGKLKRTASVNSAGIGLGLTIVKQIVESGGGIVDVSSPGLG